MALDYGVLLNQPSANQQIQQGIGQFIGIREAEAQAQAREQAATAQKQQAERAQAFQQAFGQAYQTGDKEQLTNLIGQFPEQFDMIKQAAGFKDEQRNQALGSLGIQIKTQIESGNPQAAASLIANNADVLRASGPGYEPEALVQRLQDDPAGLAKQADMFSLLTLGPDKYYEVTGGREKLAMQARGQDITARGQDVQMAEGAANRANAMNIKQLGIADKQLDREVQRLGQLAAAETNELKRKELKLKIDEKQQKLDSARKDLRVAGESAIATFDRALGTIDEIKNSKGFSSAVGVPGITAFIPGTAAKETQGLIESLKSQAFLAEVEKMKGLGALTEREGAALTSAVGSLQLDMPEEAFTRSLDRIDSYFRAGKSRIVDKYGAPSRVGSDSPVAEITSQAQFDALPSGSVYMEDGVQYRKP